MKAWLTLVAALASSPAFADGDAPPPPPPAATPPPAAPPVAAEPPVTPPGAHPEDGGADFVPAIAPKDIVITTEGERTGQNIALVAGLASGAALLLGVGLYYNLDSQSGANAVNASMSSGRVWTPADQADYDRAHDSAIKAGVFYGVGGAVLIGSIVTLIVTEPKSENTIIHPHAAPTVAPTPGGAVFGGAWRF